MGQQLGHNKFVENALKYGFSLWGPPKTGQTTKHRTGDDGDFQKGYPKDPPRFKDNGDGTITDNATGLMWVADPTVIGPAWKSNGDAATMTWDDCIDICNALDYAGHKDWRLPNIYELQSILCYQFRSPMIDESFFPNTRSFFYWSSSTRHDYTSRAFRLSFGYGEFIDSFKTYAGCPRPVRLGIPKD